MKKEIFELYESEKEKLIKLGFNEFQVNKISKLIPKLGKTIKDMQEIGFQLISFNGSLIILTQEEFEVNKDKSKVYVYSYPYHIPIDDYKDISYMINLNKLEI